MKYNYLIGFVKPNTNAFVHTKSFMLLKDAREYLSSLGKDSFRFDYMIVKVVK